MSYEVEFQNRHPRLREHNTPGKMSAAKRQSFSLDLVCLVSCNREWFGFNAALKGLLSCGANVQSWAFSTSSTVAIKQNDAEQ